MTTVLRCEPRSHGRNKIISHMTSQPAMQPAFLPFFVYSHGGFETCAKQVWALLLVQRAKLVAARDWRQS